MADTIPAGWHPLSHMPIGDHRFIVVEYLGLEGQTAFGYWTGKIVAKAPVNHRSHEPLGFEPVALRHSTQPNTTPFATPEEIRFAQTIVDSDPVLRVYAACEWDSLHDDGKEWVAVIIREAIKTTTRATCEPDWLKIAKSAGEHGVRYRTNASLIKFLDAVRPPLDSVIADLSEANDATSSHGAAERLRTDLPRTAPANREMTHDADCISFFAASPGPCDCALDEGNPPKAKASEVREAFEVGYSACWAEMCVQSGQQPAFTLSDAVLDRAWSIYLATRDPSENGD